MTEQLGGVESMATTKLLTMDEAAERLNVKRRYIKHLIYDRKRLDSVKIGGLVRICQDSLEELVASGYRPASSDSG